MKTVKLPYLCNRLTDFDEIWHGDADWPPTRDTPLKFRISQKKQDGGGRHLEKPQKSRYHNNGLARLCRMGLLNAQTVKKLNFQNPRWRTAAILKTVKSPHLSNRLTDFDEIWHTDVEWPLTGGISLKFSIFQKPTWRRQPS